MGAGGYTLNRESNCVPSAMGRRIDAAGLEKNGGRQRKDGMKVVMVTSRVYVNLVSSKTQRHMYTRVAYITEYRIDEAI